MKKFEVWSTPYEGAPQLEVTRTDAKVAHDDATLIRSILHRHAEVREIESSNANSVSLAA